MIIAQLASIPERHSILHRVVSSLIEQVDEIRLAMKVNIVNDDIADASLDPNNVDPRLISMELPKWLIHRKIKITYHNNSLQDGSKFINAPTEPGHYVLVCDDDIGYPDNFASHMTSLLHNPFKDKAILSCMGKVLAPRPIRSYFRDEIACMKTFETQKALYAVEIPGTCAMVYNTDHVVITSEAMKSPNSDICVGAWAKAHGVRCYTIPHDGKWLTDLTSLLPVGSTNMFDRYKEDDSVLTEFVNANL
jgi:hypothetical protein